MRSSPPCDRHAAELTLLSVVEAEAATHHLPTMSRQRQIFERAADVPWLSGFRLSTVPPAETALVPLHSSMRCCRPGRKQCLARQGRPWAAVCVEAIWTAKGASILSFGAAAAMPAKAPL